MEKYQELISKISNEIAFEFIGKEENLSSRALLLDADIAKIVKKIGMETTEIILNETCESFCKKNVRKG